MFYTSTTYIQFKAIKGYNSWISIYFDFKQNRDVAKTKSFNIYFNRGYIYKSTNTFYANLYNLKHLNNAFSRVFKRDIYLGKLD